ncbi:unnamed protein product [Symbiodinium sp. CCMP2456]|nr:unnamed protein product [Symbiodinium sp. CCMP2456]
MPLWSMLSMRPSGWSSPAAPQTDFAGLTPVRESLLSAKRQGWLVLVVGNGLLSHWATVWIFENGEVFSAELLARDLLTGERWGGSDFQMRGIQGYPDLRGGRPGLHGGNSKMLRRLISTNDPDLVARCETCRAIVAEYLHQYGYMIMTHHYGRFETSPADVYAKAEAVPLNGSQYDMLFHNCQLWVVMLLHDGYHIGFHELPTAIGAVVAGPLLLVVELCFLGFYLFLRHLLPVISVVFGVMWFSLLVWFSVLYIKRAQRLFSWEVIVGGSMVLGIPVFDKSASLAAALPFITLVWDLVVVYQSMRQTKVFESGFLIVWNFGATLVSVGLASVVQTCYGVQSVPDVASHVLGAVVSTLHAVGFALCSAAGAAASLVLSAASKFASNIFGNIALLLLGAAALADLLFSLLFLQPPLTMFRLLYLQCRNRDDDT